MTPNEDFSKAQNCDLAALAAQLGQMDGGGRGTRCIADQLGKAGFQKGKLVIIQALEDVRQFPGGGLGHEFQVIPSSARLASRDFPGPKQSKCLPMPTDDGVGFDNDEGRAPLGPYLGQPYP